MSKINDLLAQLDDAVETMEQRTKALQTIRQDSAEAVAGKQQELDSVKSDCDAQIAEAQKYADEARAAVESLRTQVNERLGSLTGLGTDPRVTVR